jgi:predicted AAA+ superfamily ATPase
MVEYSRRVVDAQIVAALESSGAVLLEGPKASGKTLTAVQFAKTVRRLDEGADESSKDLLELDPALLLQGETPVLIDEWQEEPTIWNRVRREVDDRQAKGQFILTGSSTPDDSVRRHSGAGRFSIIQMRPMSLFESGHSTGQVSLARMFDGEAPRAFDPAWTATRARESIAERIVAGGWPGSLGQDVRVAARTNEDYVALISEHDIQRLSGVSRSPAVVMRVMRSLARNVAAAAREATLARDARAGEESGPDATSRPTVAEHLDALTRLRILEDQPAWAPTLRSSRRLRTSPKRHFVDPSIGIAALGIDVERLAVDPKTLGFHFESLCVRDLRVYAQPLRGRVSYYHDDSGLEADAVIELPDGRWGAIEVKLGTLPRTIDSAAAGLLKLSSRVADNRRAFLMVLTNGGIAHRRPDGVDVVPIHMLGP